MSKTKDRITFVADGFGSITGTIVAPDGYKFSMVAPKTKEAKQEIRKFLVQQEQEYCLVKGDPTEK